VGVINFDAVLQPMRVAVVRVNKKIGLIADLNLKSLAEQVVKKIVVLVHVPPEIAEINANPSLHPESIGVFPFMATVFSLIPPRTGFKARAGPLQESKSARLSGALNLNQSNRV
jgi:hypothetical protein